MSEEIQQRLSALRRSTEAFSIDFQINVINAALQSETELARMETYVAEQVAKDRAKKDEAEEVERREAAERDRQRWAKHQAQQRVQMQQQASKPKRRGFAEITAAFHEAGHAVACAHHGITIVGLEIDAKGRGNIFQEDDGFPLAARATMIAAGAAAERLFCPGLNHLLDPTAVTDDDFIYSTADSSKVARIAALDQKTFPAGRDAFEIAVEMASEILPRYRGAVVALAHGLLEHGKLSGAQVGRIIAAHPPHQQAASPTALTLAQRPEPQSVTVRPMTPQPPPITVLAQAAPANVVVEPQPPPVVINVNIEMPATKRRVTVKRDKAGDMTGAEIEDEPRPPVVTIERQF